MCAQNFHRNNNKNNKNSNYNKTSKTATCLCSGLALAFWGPLHHTPHTHTHHTYTHTRYICNFIGNTRDAAADNDRATYVKQSSEVSLPLPLTLLLSLPSVCLRLEVLPRKLSTCIQHLRAHHILHLPLFLPPSSDPALALSVRRAASCKSAAHKSANLII